MATHAQIKALLAVPCPWCGVQAGTRCVVRIGSTSRVPSTLDGESHDARWQRAIGTGARVLGAQAEALAGRRAQAPISLAASGDRPW